MDDPSNTLDALRFISDWAKWLITIETGAIAIIGTMLRADSADQPESVRVFATGAIACFVCSIIAAAVLLLSLPEIAQNLQAGTNIWLTSDSVLGRVFGLNTQTLAALESVFFGMGILCFAGAILAVAWSPKATGRPARKDRNAT